MRNTKKLVCAFMAVAFCCQCGEDRPPFAPLKEQAAAPGFKVVTKLDSLMMSLSAGISHEQTIVARIADQAKNDTIEIRFVGVEKVYRNSMKPILFITSPDIQVTFWDLDSIGVKVSKPDTAIEVLPKRATDPVSPTIRIDSVIVTMHPSKKLEISKTNHNDR